MHILKQSNEKSIIQDHIDRQKPKRRAKRRKIDGELYLPLSEAREIIGISETTIKSWIDKGKLTFKQIAEGKHAFYYVLEKDCILAAERKKIEKEKIKKEDDIVPIAEQVESNNVSTDRLKNVFEKLGLNAKESDKYETVLKNLSKEEADVLIKIEQASEKQLSNLIKQGKYVEKEEVQAKIQEVFSVFARNIKDLPMIWIKKFNLDDKLLKQMELDIFDALKKATDGVQL